MHLIASPVHVLRPNIPFALPPRGLMLARDLLVRRPHAPKESSVHHHSRPDARPRCRREHRDFQRRERRAASAVSLRESRAAGDDPDGHEGAQRHQLSDRARQHARPQGTSDRFREYRGDQCGPWKLRRRRRKARTDHHCGRDHEFLLGPRHANRLRTQLRRNGRNSAAASTAAGRRSTARSRRIRRTGSPR